MSLLQVPHFITGNSLYNQFPCSSLFFCHLVVSVYHHCGLFCLSLIQYLINLHCSLNDSSIEEQDPDSRIELNTSMFSDDEDDLSEDASSNESLRYVTVLPVPLNLHSMM